MDGDHATNSVVIVINTLVIVLSLRRALIEQFKLAETTIRFNERNEQQIIVLQMVIDCIRGFEFTYQ